MDLPVYQATNLHTRVEEITSHWTPQHIATVNGSHSLKLATISGPFIWHSHPETDELFLCVSGGPFNIELCTTASSPAEAEKLGADQVVRMKVGDVFNVPKGMQHRPMAEGEPAGILMVEKVGTVNTGDRDGDEEGRRRTVHVEER